MRRLVITASLVACATGAAAEQPAPGLAAPATSFVLPRAYQGYAQPEIGPCRTVNPNRAECSVPPMTAGRYLIEARAVATASGTNATQALSLTIGQNVCAATNKATFTGKAGLHLLCEANLLTDAPLAIAAAYQVENGAADVGGPRMTVRRLPWDGVLESRGVLVRGRPEGTSAPAAAPKSAPGQAKPG